MNMFFTHMYGKYIVIDRYSLIIIAENLLRFKRKFNTNLKTVVLIKKKTKYILNLF